MRKIQGENFFTGQKPLKPINIDEPCHYVRCNLLNCLVHPKSILEHCQELQVIFGTEDIDIDGKVYPIDKEPVRVGKGIKGEITPQMVTTAEAIK